MKMSVSIAYERKKNIYPFIILHLFVILFSSIFSSTGTKIAYGQPIEWWDTDWMYRKPLFINSSLVEGSHANFPVLVDITDAYLSITAQAHGEDIVFTDENNIKLSHEIESYNSTSGHLIAWVRVPQLSSTQNTKIYMYYSNLESHNQEDPKGVWDSNYKMVLHLDEIEKAHDSTSNGKNGVIHRGVSLREGIVDSAFEFFVRMSRYDYWGGYIKIDNSTDLSGFENFTASFWIILKDTHRRQTILNKYDILNNRRSWFIDFQDSNQYGPVFQFFASQDGDHYSQWSANFNPSLDKWSYVTIVWESGSVPAFYIDGVQVSTIGDSIIQSIYENNEPLYVGNCSYRQDRELNGYLDEIRISNSNRSADWIITEYNNQRYPSKFIALGDEETLPDPPFILDPVPHNYANVSIELSELSFYLMDYQGDLMNYSVITIPNIGIGEGFNVGNGRYSIPVNGLERLVSYNWIIKVTDGTNTIQKIFTFTPAGPEDDVIPPIADAGSDKTIVEDQPFTFDASNSTDNVGISNYTWTFFDKIKMQSLNGVKPTHIFAAPGVYQVILAVTDSSGNQDTDTILISVKDITNPIAKAGKDKTVYVGNNITLDGSSSSDNVNITTYKWDLGDGTIEKGKQISHIYAQKGDYNITLEVIDFEGNVGVDLAMITVLPPEGSGAYLLIIFVTFILIIISIAHRLLFIRPRARLNREITRLEYL